MKKQFLLFGLILLLVLFTPGCKYNHKGQTPATSLDTMEHIDYREMLDQKERTYYIFIHRNDCQVCARLEPEIVNYYNTGDLRVYSIDTSEERNQGIKGKCLTTANCRNTIPIDTKDYNDIKIVTSPTLIKVKRGRVVEYFDEATKIKAALS